MKIKVTKKSYDEVCKIERKKHRKPVRPARIVRKILKVLSQKELKEVNFSYEFHGMERLKSEEPCLILMNHSSFIDLKICMSIFSNRPFNIVCTSDGFVGKEFLMRRIGCIPAIKFVTDLHLLKDMKYAVDELQDSILMFPEASYSFDGTATPLPEGVGKCIKFLEIPVIMIKTSGAFIRDPLYNNLQRRKVDVSADVTYLWSRDDVQRLSIEELNHTLKNCFDFDNFKWQQQNRIKVEEKFRADYLNRVLFKCPHCLSEGKMLGKGTTLTCTKCGQIYELTEYGELEARKGEGKFNHIPDWYKWQRDCVKEEILKGDYSLNIPVKICMLVDNKSIYEIGEGVLSHSKDGFHLIGAQGKLNYKQRPEATYSLYADYFWYELGDMICIGNNKVLYYCFPMEEGDVVAKTRLATEELFKLAQAAKV